MPNGHTIQFDEGVGKVLQLRELQTCDAWKRALQKDKVIIETNPVIPLNPTEEKAIAIAAQRFGNFVGLPVEY